MSYRSRTPHVLSPVLRHCKEIGHTVVGATPEARARSAAQAARAATVTPSSYTECGLADVHRCADLILAEVPE